MSVPTPTQSIFTEIYLTGAWQGGFPETASGAGSTLDSTAQFRGGYRPLNFALPPFKLPKPLLRIPDHLGEHEKCVCLWTAAQICLALGPGEN